MKYPLNVGVNIAHFILGNYKQPDHKPKTLKGN